MSRIDYARGTFLEYDVWGGYERGAAICPDGRTRTLKRISPHADTFFSIPAAVTYKSRVVTGFVTVSTLGGYSTASDDDPAAVWFTPNRYGKNGALIPHHPYGHPTRWEPCDGDSACPNVHGSPIPQPQRIDQPT